jgi:hypothetical protein
MKCCICENEIDIQYAPNGEVAWTQGHNPEPVKDEGRCCSACNWGVVVPQRITDFFVREKSHVTNN